MMIISNLKCGTFINRPNRFTITFESGQKVHKAHLRDPGRLKDLLIPGRELLLKPVLDRPARKTRYDVVGVLADKGWVVINSGLHNEIASELIKSGRIKEFSNYSIEKREYGYGGSRIDFLLSNKKKMLLEVKGCTLVKDGIALFPDAPTLRGRKHVKELIKAKDEKMDAAILFLIMRKDATTFSPNHKTDPKFSHTLKDAHHKNVSIIAYSFKNIYKNKKLEIKPFKRIKIKF